MLVCVAGEIATSPGREFMPTRRSYCGRVPGPGFPSRPETPRDGRQPTRTAVSKGRSSTSIQRRAERRVSTGLRAWQTMSYACCQTSRFT